METVKTRRESGFSLVEVLVAAAILLLVVLGLVPLFHQSMLYSASGREATAITNQSLSTVEEYYQLPFNNRDLDLAAAGGNVVVQEFWNSDERAWEDTESAATQQSIPKRSRTTTVRQYSLNSLGDNVLDPGEGLAGGANVREIHFKETEILLVSEGSNGLGGQIQLRRLKAY